MLQIAFFLDCEGILKQVQNDKSGSEYLLKNLAFSLESCYEFLFQYFLNRA
jgi:hypothetical protein